MSSILKGIKLNEADPRNFDSDIDYYNALNRKMRGRSEDDYVEPQYDEPIKFQQDPKARPEYSINKDEDRDVGYNMTLIVKAPTTQKAEFAADRYIDSNWGAKKQIGKITTIADGVVQVHMIDNHKYGMWKPWKDEEPIDKPISFNESAIINKASKLLESLSPESRISIINELSNDLLGNYKKAAGADATAADKKGEYKRGDKRMSGIIKATKKQFANDEKKATESRYDSGDYYNARHGREYGMDLQANTTGSSYREPNKGDGTGERGRPQKLKGVSNSLPADAFGRTTGKIPAGKTGRIHSMMNDVDEDLDENLHKWFKEKWVRFGPDGKIRGDCARGDDSEGKPKCLPQSKAQNLGKKGRASAASRKRREDPNPERSGKAINVNTKKKTNEQELDEACWKGYHKEGNKKMFGKTYPNCVKNTNEEQEQHSESCPHCGGEMVSEELMNEKKDACYYKVKSRYKVWPSAYASGALVKCRKKGASNWGNGGKSNESVEEGWKDEAQELEDWAKEVNTRLYRAHESQRLGLARQLSKLEQKHFGSEFTHPNLTEIVWSALRALQKGEMVHYDPQRVGQMPFGSAVGDDAKLIAQYSITRDELAGYRMLHDKGMVDNLEQFLKLRRLVRAKSWPLEYFEELEKLTPEEAWLKMANDLNWSKDDMNEEVQAKTDDNLRAYYAQRKAEKQKQQSQSQDQLDEKWSQKYKDSINCSNPKGFSQKAHCAGKQKNESAIMKGLK